MLTLETIDPSVLYSIREVLAKIDLSNVVKNNIINKTIIDNKLGCWLYTGSLSDGYGRVYYKHKLESLSRLVLGLTLDDVMLALHKRECPNRNCWNPKHLYSGTYADNTNDSVATGTFSKHELVKTHCPQGHEYTPDNTQYQGNKRKCRECSRLRKNPFGKRKLPIGQYYNSKKD